MTNALRVIAEEIRAFCQELLLDLCMQRAYATAPAKRTHQRARIRR